MVVGGRKGMEGTIASKEDPIGVARTAELLQRFLPHWVPLAGTLTGRQSLFSTAKAAAAFDYRPTRSWLDGATNPTLDGSEFYTRPVTGWPSTDPLVTAVGGTQIKQSASGKWVWPGRDGATLIARKLAASLPHLTVCWALAPDGAKDVRAWLAGRQGEP